MKTSNDDDHSRASLDTPSRKTTKRYVDNKSYQHQVSSCQFGDQSTAIDDILSKELLKHEQLQNQIRKPKDETYLGKIKFPDIRQKQKNLHRTIALLEEMQGFRNFARFKKRKRSLRRASGESMSKDTLHFRDNSSLSSMPSQVKLDHKLESKSLSMSLNVQSVTLPTEKSTSRLRGNA